MDPSSIATVSPEALVLGGMFASIAGALLSLAMKYVPGLSDWYAKQASGTKSLLMAVLVVISAVGVAFWTCSDGACAAQGNWKVYVMAIFGALMANQATHQITPTPGDASKRDESEKAQPSRAANWSR